MQSVARWTKRDGAWLVMAILAHALLLLVPLKQPDTDTVAAATIKIDLVPFVSTAPEDAARKIEPAADRPAPPAPQTDTAGPDKPEPVQNIEADEQAAENRFTTAYLLELARNIEQDKPPPNAPRQLGAYVPRDLPANWRQGAGAASLQPIDNVFNGMTVPVRTEIVDRWLAADGSQNVVVNLPNGQTLCGRAEAWKPLQPLVEHVMMFGACGGGGKRTFSMRTQESAAMAKAAWADQFD